MDIFSEVVEGTPDEGAAIAKNVEIQPKSDRIRITADIAVTVFSPLKV
jgi:hypothetical protein